MRNKEDSKQNFQFIFIVAGKNIKISLQTLRIVTKSKKISKLMNSKVGLRPPESFPLNYNPGFGDISIMKGSIEYSNVEMDAILKLCIH